MHKPHPAREFPDFGLTPEQRRFAVRGHYYEYPGMDGERGEIWCYTDRFSYRPGEVAHLHVSATAKSFAIEIVRDGATETGVFQQQNIACRWQDTPDQCSVEGCGWEPAFEIAIGEDWPSGAYRVTLRPRVATAPTSPAITFSSSARNPARNPAASCKWRRRAPGCPTTHGADRTLMRASPAMAATSMPAWSRLQRPWCRGFVVLPSDAPRVPLEISMPPKTVPRYPHMEWALATGHSKKYASAGWASYDSHFFRWAERTGYAVDLASQHDLHFTPEILAGYDCVVFVGHDEYWTWEMRDAVDHYVERGGHAARFAGNFMWQTRLEDEGRRQVCYKYRARAEDPIYQSDDVTRATNSWDAPEIGRPGVKTFGLNSSKGVYAGWGGCTPRGVRGFPVYRPEHWAFADTGLFYGDLLGADSHVYGYEVDGLDYEIRNGRPYPTAASGAPDGLEILAMGMASQVEEADFLNIEDQFFGDEDGRFIAEMLHGDASDENLEKVRYSNGMIVNFPRGKGEVFHAGSCEWVAGLLRHDAMVERVTANVLDRFLGKGR